MTPAEPTIGEIGRILVEVRADMAAVRAKLDGLDASYVRRDVYEEASRSRDQRISDLEASHTWLVRTVGGLVLTAGAAILTAVRVVGL